MGWEESKVKTKKAKAIETRDHSRKTPAGSCLGLESQARKAEAKAAAEVKAKTGKEEKAKARAKVKGNPR